MIIGISGRARTGKDTIADYLVSHYGFTRLSFGDNVRDAVKAIYGVDTTKVADREAVIPQFGKSSRELLQFVGTDLCRVHVGQNVWVDRVAQDVAETEGDIVFSDVRFDNEAEFIRNNGIIMTVERDVPKVNEHISESGIVKMDCDIKVVNDGTLLNLYEKIDQIIAVSTLLPLIKFNF